MQLHQPLLGLIRNCETLCEAACCGRDAYDFSPIHVASFLIRYTGRIEADELAALGEQLRALDARYGENGSISDGTVIEEMNQAFAGHEITALVKEISQSLSRAPELVRLAEEGDPSG